MKKSLNILFIVFWVVANAVPVYSIRVCLVRKISNILLDILLIFVFVVGIYLINAFFKKEWYKKDDKLLEDTYTDLVFWLPARTFGVIIIALMLINIVITYLTCGKIF